MYWLAINEAIVRQLTLRIQDKLLSYQLGPIAAQTITYPKGLIQKYFAPLKAIGTVAAEEDVRLRFPSCMWWVELGLLLFFLMCGRHLCNLFIVQELPSGLVHRLFLL